jgi:DNA-3-methyladenine glycosylase
MSVGEAARLRRSDYGIGAETMARRLIGQRLVRLDQDGTRVSGVIVETEAYLGEEDLGSHAARGRRTARNESMYGPPGLLYVYFTYGMHFCANVVCGRREEPVAVLLRALAPEEGLDLMRARRQGGGRRMAERDLCSGPAKLCQALGLDRAWDGVDLVESASIWIERTRTRSVAVSRLSRTGRVGLGLSAGDWGGAPLRWALRGSEHVSRGPKN